ncbi:hypothetical protein CALVIDRAFT_247 [Calocera viscosa TUFC12733]|uniref:Uncharacterized protein n=1 Tax=Calocera viscosa (strain TUFC12733) TaxID=1330018 RepID=A0A167RYD6_CALVF|nr:hypothetical protein CALVIDRAFT_247 [Calocera viscosa TUFC12733]
MDLGGRWGCVDAGRRVEHVVAVYRDRAWRPLLRDPTRTRHHPRTAHSLRGHLLGGYDTSTVHCGDSIRKAFTSTVSSSTRHRFIAILISKLGQCRRGALGTGGSIGYSAWLPYCYRFTVCVSRALQHMRLVVLSCIQPWSECAGGWQRPTGQHRDSLSEYNELYLSN